MNALSFESKYNLWDEIMWYKNYLSRIDKSMISHQYINLLNKLSIDNEIEDEVNDTFEIKDIENDKDKIIILKWEIE